MLIAQTHNDLLPKAADFAAYRAVCHQEDTFHEVGLLDQDSYTQALADPRTVLAVVNGRLMPAVTPLELEDGYDAERTARLSERERVMLASLPFSVMASEDGAVRGLIGNGTLENTAIVIEEPRIEDPVQRAEQRAKVAAFLSGLGVLEEAEFIDPRVEAINGHGESWLSLYSFTIHPSEKALEAPAAADIDEAWAQLQQEADGELETRLFTPQEFASDPDLIDKLWAMSEEGFGNILGAFHPVSMEESKQFFMKHLISEGSYTAIHFKDGEPVCFGSLLFEIEDDCDWLNHDSSSMAAERQAALSKGEIPVFFTDIISNARGASYSPKVMRLFMDLAGRTRQNYRVMFESSNFASTFIPMLVGRLHDYKGYSDIVRDVEQHDKIAYWMLRTASDTSETIAA